MQRLDPSHKPHQIVFIAEREHGIDQIVAHAFFPESNFQPIGEKLHDFFREIDILLRKPLYSIEQIASFDIKLLTNKLSNLGNCRFT